MVGVSFVGPKEEIERVALELLNTENFEPMSPEVMLDERPLGSRVQTFRGNRYDVLLEKLEGVWVTAGLPVPQKRPADRYLSLSFSEMESKTDLIVRTLSEWQAKVEELQNEYDTWRAMLKLGDVVRETGRNLSDLARVPYGRVAIGTLTQENWRRLEETSHAAPFLALPLIVEELRVTAVVFYGSDFRDEMQKIFDSVHIRQMAVGREEFARYDNADATRYHMESLEAEIQNYKAMPARYILENGLEVEKLYNSVYAKQRVYTLACKRGEMAGMLVLSGWIPQSSYDEVFRMTNQKAPHTMIMAEYGDTLEEQGNELPTLLHNLPLIRRFQEIVRLYSLPSYSELDPTFVVALSFCLFFGFMFGDVGHGLVLILGTWYLEKKGIMGRAIASVMKVAGTSAVLFGFLYGSVFGSEELIPALWLSPMKDVNTLLPVSIGVGVAFLTLGICFRIQNSARKGEWGEVLFSPEGLCGLLFYWLAVTQVVALSSGNPETVFEKDIFTTIMVLLFLVMIFGNGIAKFLFHGESIDEGGVIHVFSIFHAMLNFISNTASFVRLAAFALNHAGLCGAVFMLGEMVENAPGGKLYHAFILLLGNAVIVGLEGLIVFIQTLRLEYYEFFGKFFRGGGREFAPILWKRPGRMP